MKTREIILKYTAGEATLQETNAKLKEVRAGFHLDPQRNYISPAEIDLYGLMESGTGYLDKVRVSDLKLNHPANEVKPDGSVNMPVQVYYKGKAYHVYGDQLVEDK